MYMQRTIERTLGEPVPPRLETRDGLAMRLRPVTAHDRPFVADLYSRVAIDDFRFRFLTGLKAVNPQTVVARIEVDHHRAEHLLAFDPASERLCGSLIICADSTMESAEVAVVVEQGFRGRGIGWCLLRHAADLAKERQFRAIRTVETLAAHNPAEVLRCHGIEARPCAVDPTLVLLEWVLG